MMRCVFPAVLGNVVCLLSGNGVIDFDEFSAWMQKTQKQQVPEAGARNGDTDQQEMIQLFHIFDKDNDG